MDAHILYAAGNGCMPSSRPGTGFVDPKLWYERKIDPTFFDLNLIDLRTGYGY